ncbi:MAG: BatA and WFA domain-containing protein [Terrimicrobiaceae bacterium]
MTFLEPLMALGGLAAIPVILLYLIRQVPVRRVIPSILLWQGLPGRSRDSVSWRRVRRWLSLLLQLLFVALVVLALCQPQPGSGAPGLPTVLVLDNSASMAAGGRLEELKKSAAAWLRSMPPGSEACLLTTAPDPAVLLSWTSDTARQLAALDGLGTADRPVGSEAALRLAVQLAQSRGGRVVLVTDGVGRGRFRVPEGITVSLVEGMVANSGITRFGARRSPAGPDDILLFAKVHVGAGGADHEGGRARLVLERGGRVVDARDLGPGDSMQEWTYPAEGPAQFALRLEPADGFLIDNRAELEVSELPTVEVLFISEPDPIWEAALGAIPGVRVTRVWPPEALRYGDPSKVAIFQGASPPPDFQAAGLILIDPSAEGFWGKPVGLVEDLAVSQAAVDDPVLRLVQLEKIGVTSATEFKIAPEARVLASADGVPLIFGRWDREPRWLVLAFNPRRSDWVLKASFPVFLANLLDAVRGETGQPLVDERLHPAMTALAPQQLTSESAPGLVVQPPGWPIWWWLLAVATAWLLVEWGTFHRRLSE